MKLQSCLLGGSAISLFMGTYTMKYLYHILLIMILALLFSGCTNSESPQDFEYVTTPEVVDQSNFANTGSNSSGYPAALGSEDNGGYPAPLPAQGDGEYPVAITTDSSRDGRAQTALQSYEKAYAVALTEFHPDAYLAAIAPSHIMLTNLGNPPVLPGWFFKFRKPDSRREFIVQVVDDVISGSTLTESAMELATVENPIDISQINIDSDDVLEKFKTVGEERGLWSEYIAYDLELVNLSGTSGPVWSIVDPLTQEWLFSVNAITGEEVENPYQQ